MATDPLSDVLELPVSERIRAVQMIWDSVAARPDEVPVTEAQRAELEARLQAYREAPHEVEAWDDVERRLRSGD